MNTEKKQKQKQKQKKKILRDWMFLGLTIGILLLILFLYPEKTQPVTVTAWDYFMEMIIILPAVMIIMGIFSVYISDETVVTYLGKASGIKGIGLSLFLGALPTGPLYVAFPMAATLLKKGARTSNIIVFLSAWACIKLPQELVELQFLGFDFMLSRLLLTIGFVILMGYLIERLIDGSNKKNLSTTQKPVLD
ncbi:MAG: permease [Candidatus Thermoplasmatota archaeon]|nr:permease [Candidatus Thermoplasmatota archaeon]